MNQEDFFGRAFESAQPAQDFTRIGVRREVIQPFDMRANRYELAENFDLFFAVNQTTAARSNGLKAGEDHRVAFVRQSFTQMMQDAPSGGHPAGRNDDG